MGVHTLKQKTHPCAHTHKATHALGLLNRVLHNLSGSNTHFKLLFIDLSSAFNIIQHHILADKLITNFSLDLNLVGWLKEIRVNVNGSLSAFLTTSTSSPQSCDLSPLLYILYTNHCTNKYNNRYFLKSADDTVIVSLLENNNICHGPVVDDFLKWYNDPFL